MATLLAHIGNNASQDSIISASRPHAATAGGSSGTSSSTTSATISANDFLTLLVTELQNQDPTASTDPNEYVNQLVSVNSLEQLININQTLGSALGTTPTGGSSGAAPAGATADVAGPPATATSAMPGSVVGRAMAGNLGVPAAQPAALQVAKSLSGAR